MVETNPSCRSESRCEKTAAPAPMVSCFLDRVERLAARFMVRSSPEDVTAKIALGDRVQTEEGQAAEVNVRVSGSSPVRAIVLFLSIDCGVANCGCLVLRHQPWGGCFDEAVAVALATRFFGFGRVWVLRCCGRDRPILGW